MKIDIVPGPDTEHPHRGNQITLTVEGDLHSTSRRMDEVLLEQIARVFETGGRITTDPWNGYSSYYDVPEPKGSP